VTNYEILVILNTNGKEDLGDSMLETFISNLKEEGCEISDIEEMGHTTFIREGKNHTHSGHYVKIWLQMTCEFADSIQERFRLDESIFRILLTKNPSSFRPSDVKEEETQEPVAEEVPTPETEVSSEEQPA